MQQRLDQKEVIKEEFSVSHHITQHWSMKDYHFHDVFEIYLAMCDNVQYFVEGRVYPVQKGDILIFNNMDLHKIVIPSGITYERYVLTFQPTYVENFSTDKTDLLECFLKHPADFSYCIHPNYTRFQMLVGLFENVISMENNVYGSDIRRKILLSEILLQVNELFHSTVTTCRLNTDSDYPRVRQLLQYIAENLEGDLSLNTLSQKFFLSKSHLGYLFKKVTGFSVNEYVINRRINKARELLKKNLPVSRVGEMVGYTNDAHFIRTFKKLVGMPPKQYSRRG